MNDVNSRLFISAGKTVEKTLKESLVTEHEFHLLLSIAMFISRNSFKSSRQMSDFSSHTFRRRTVHNQESKTKIDSHFGMLHRRELSTDVRKRQKTATTNDSAITGSFQATGADLWTRNNYHGNPRLGENEGKTRHRVPSTSFRIIRCLEFEKDSMKTLVPV